MSTELTEKYEGPFTVQGDNPPHIVCVRGNSVLGMMWPIHEQTPEGEAAAVQHVTEIALAICTVMNSQEYGVIMSFADDLRCFESELTARIAELEKAFQSEINSKNIAVNKWVRRLDEAESALAEARKDSAIVDHLERLIKACPHTRFHWTDDADEEMPLGFSVTIEGCETSQVSGTTFRECMQAEMAIDALPTTPHPETKGQI